MRGVSLIIVSTCLIALGGASGQAATTCSQRNSECLKFCESNYKKAPGCTTQCADALPKCMQSGCWVTRMSNTCGLTKG